jgi:hypothetical protein
MLILLLIAKILFVQRATRETSKRPEQNSSKIHLNITPTKSWVEDKIGELIATGERRQRPGQLERLVPHRSAPGESSSSGVHMST